MGKSAIQVNNITTELRPTRNNSGTLISDQRLTVSSSAVDMLATAASEFSTHVFFDIQDNDVMATFDGSDPSVSNGHLFTAGQSGTWCIRTANTVKFIRAGSADAVVHISEFTH